ncbi:hypothetical protein MRB53_017280 [Persea americana]|uniref:Uncharacterized protein n=1 Tax=Persea americana TaxID=3435 RepID=A0ACC2M483_PERAE|nr:hypothetical protein MRB53_017280 [Persea americana]
MDSAGLYRVSSLRRNSSSIWRNGTDDVFSRSNHMENDEEALRWATLEKLPTYDRLRKGMLTRPEGERMEVDIESLGYQEKKILLDRLIKIAEEDNEKFLLKLKNRIDQVGIDIPTIEVRFEHLKVDAQAYVGSRGLPSVFNFVVNILEVLPGTTESLGVLVLKSRGILTNTEWYWIGVGALFGYILLLNGTIPLALAYLNPFGRSQSVLSEEALKEKHANRTGELNGLPSEVESSIIDPTSESRSDGIRSLPEGSTNASQTRKKGMILPFEPLSITFDNIKYSVDMPQEMKDQGITEDRLMLLKGITGAFRPGVLTALMGVSGAGKTTLMDVLAGRKTGGYIEGRITISGYLKKQETFARISGYCEQNDIHSPYVTVYESLLYSAWLRLSTEVHSDTRKLFIEEVMELVELTSLRNSLVGLPGVNGLSTEQRKRLTIAVELVANPSIIFMDEPTSGLDARAAAIVMRTVRNTVDTGRTVVCTIHQPSIDIFEAFDELFLLKRGGEEIYVGPLGHNSCQLIQYFEGIDGINKIRDGHNPATWMLEVTTEAREEALGVDFAEIYKNSDQSRRTKALVEELSKPCPGSSDIYFSTQFAQSFFTQCMACLWKQHKSYWRNTEYSAMRLMFTIFTTLMFGTMFWDLGSKT